MHVNQEIYVGSLLSSLPKSRPVTEQITELFEKSNMAGQENPCLYLQDGAPPVISWFINHYNPR